MTRITKRQAKAWKLDGAAKRKPKRNRDRRIDFSGPFSVTHVYGAMRAVRLLLPVAPSANDYWQQIMKPFPKMVLTRIAKDYRAAVQSFCLSHCVKPFGGDVAVTVTWYRASKIGDLPNRTKQLYDALNGLVWLDDEQIVRETTERKEDPRNPRMEVIVEWLDTTPLLETT